MNNEKEILAEIEKEKIRLRKRIRTYEDKEEQFKKERNQNWREREKATKELRKKIAEVERPFDKKENELHKKENNASDKRYKADRELRQVEEIVRGKYAENAKTFVTASAFKGWMANRGIKLSKVEMVKKPLKNGIVLFRTYPGYWASTSSESDEVSYFAVKDKKIVGYHHTRKAQHIGDDTSRTAFINQKKYTYATSVKLERDDPDYVYSYYSRGLRFKSWKRRLEELTKFVGADLTDEETKKMVEE